jgi:hypothetical protein
MKKISIVLLFLITFLNVYGQLYLTNAEKEELRQIRNYEEYVDFCNKHNLKVETETTWILNLASQANNTIRQDIQRINNVMVSSGTQLIKARNRIIEGGACALVSGGLFYVGAITYSNSVDKALLLKQSAAREYAMSDAKQIRNIIYTGAGMFALAGVTFEIMGLLHIGKQELY